MKSFVSFMAATAAIGGLAVPAAAQYAPAPYPQYQPQYPQQAYPQYQYPQTQYPQAYPQTGYAYPGQQAYGQQGYGQQNTVGAIIGQLLGNRYNVTDRTAVTQCATAAQAQAAARYRPNSYGQNYGQGYNAYNSARVTGITNVERRNKGLRVSGLMSSGQTSRGWGNQGYNPAYANVQSDLTFRCNVDYRGQVTNVRVNRNNAYRG